MRILWCKSFPLFGQKKNFVRFPYLWLNECWMRWIHYLFSQRPAGSLRMCPQHTWLHVLWLEVLLNLTGPQSARSSHLCYLHVEIHSNSPEERQARCKAVDIESSFKTWSERGEDNNMSKRWRQNGLVRWTLDRAFLGTCFSKIPKDFVKSYHDYRAVLFTYS